MIQKTKKTKPKKKEESISQFNNYVGYINQIKELEEKVSKDDFLQLHEPLEIEGESIYNNEAKKELRKKNKKFI